MQSFIQYRKFRSALQIQLEKDKDKAHGIEPHTRTAGSEQSPSSATSDDSKVDLEKGGSSSDPTDGGRGPNGTKASILGPGEKEEKEQEQEPEDDDDDDFELGHNFRNTLSRTTTQQSAGTALGRVVTGINIRRRTTREGGDGNVFVVGYESESDPLDPHNWSFAHKIRCTILVASIGWAVGFASAIDSAAIPQAAKDFGVSEVVESMATGIFLIGFGCGALVSGPISETVGRNPVYIGTLALFMVFVMASGLAPNIGAQLAFRFLAGIFGATPLTCAGGSLSDIWDPLERVFAFPIFANAAFSGPLMGPVIGSFIAQSSAVSWRWVEWSR